MPSLMPTLSSSFPFVTHIRDHIHSSTVVIRKYSPQPRGRTPRLILSAVGKVKAAEAVNLWNILDEVYIQSHN